MVVQQRISTWLTIGELAERTGVATSALRFYEDRGLINARIGLVDAPCSNP